MGRIVAIDYGRRRTGVAVSDPLKLIGNALDTVPTHRLEEFLAQYLAQNDVDTIVMGMPTQMDGSPSETFSLIKPFVERLRKRFPGVEVVLYDERFTSVLAHRALIEGGVKKMDRRNKGLIDRISATLILQGYLDSRSYQERKERENEL